MNGGESAEALVWLWRGPLHPAQPRPTIHDPIRSYHHVHRHSLAVGFPTPTDCLGNFRPKRSSSRRHLKTSAAFPLELTPNTTRHNGQDLVSQIPTCPVLFPATDDKPMGRASEARRAPAWRGARWAAIKIPSRPTWYWEALRDAELALGVRAGSITTIEFLARTRYEASHRMRPRWPRRSAHDSSRSVD